MSATQP